MKNNMISVIVPVYNTENYLKKCLDSLCSQTYNDLQIILIDDGSSDASLQICNEYAGKDERFEVYCKKNGGVSSARNFGLKKAQGRYISFVDSDDFLEKETYQTIVDQIGDCDALYFGYKEIFDEYSDKIVSPKKSGSTGPYDALYECLIPLGYYSSVCNKVFRRELVKEIEFDEDIQVGEDELWLVKVTPSLNKVMLLNKQLYNYVQRDDSAMHTDFSINEKWMSALESKKQILNKLSKNARCYSISLAKTYSDLYNLKWFAYINSDYESLKQIARELKPFRSQFYDSSVYSIQKKIKFFLIDLMIFLRFPKKIVSKIGDMTSFKIVNKEKK